jgi:mRNA-degrading endonuclease RelE of RelBE toxin-antitoxin system
MPYELNIPSDVKLQFKEYVRGQDALRKQLRTILRDLRSNPHHSNVARSDLLDVFFVELGDYRLYFVIDDDKEEIRLFHFRRYWYHW